ncbi:MAG: caspase family protein, partial [Alphaproteobacteria bacterium]|nr:caspase family protein [Alphaproteobacteria bacterium]
MRFPILRLLQPVAALALALGMTISARAEESRLLRSAVDGDVRALVIGIDAYQHVPQLKGAVADALDIDGALRRGRVTDITTLIDAKADRASVISAINGLAERSGPHDLVIISVAGHGAQEPERLKGSQPDGLENVFLLAGFDKSATGSRERILGAEFYHFIKEFEARGTHVIFVADTCFGGGLTRDIDPRWEEMSFRQVPSYRLTSDQLQPVTTAADELATDTDFDRTVFLAAVDRRTKAPEVQIPGIAGLRGALSYSVARALEGNVASRSDGSTTLQDFLSYLRQYVYQLSNQRQNIVTTAPPGENPRTDIVFRSVMVENSPAAAPQAASDPIKIAVVDDKRDHFAGL